MITTIGIIGSGRIGSAIARLAVAADLNVVLSNTRGPASLEQLIAELGDHASADTPEGAARAGDIVVAAVPLNAYTSLPATALAGRTVIDAMNYYPDRDGRIAKLETGEITSSQLLQRYMPSSFIVKGFNNIDYHRLFINARPSGSTERSTLPIAGDSLVAKEHIAQLADALGYDTFDLGSLANSWRTQPGTPIYVQPYLGPESAETGATDPLRRFLDRPGVPVPATRVQELVTAATRTSVGG